MRAGRLDRKITIQRRVVTQGPDGGEIETWDTVSLRRWASWGAVKADERFADPQQLAEQQVEFRVRYSSDISGINAQWRIIYPALSGDSPSNDPEESAIYDVLAINELGRREGLQILAKRRADIAA